jgi:uncharacterized protein YcnI
MNTSRLSMLLVLATVVVVASAHVTVSPRQITGGTGGDFVIKVPTERPVPTIKVRVEFPHGFQVSRLKAKQGWTAEAERDTAKAIKAVTWSGGKIGPDEFDDFTVSARIAADAGPVLAIKAYQTYEGGEIAEWTDTLDSQSKKPAPKITVIQAPSKFATTAKSNWLGASALLLGLVAVTMSMRNSKNGKTH